MIVGNKVKVISIRAACAGAGDSCEGEEGVVLSIHSLNYTEPFAVIEFNRKRICGGKCGIPIRRLQVLNTKELI